MSNILTWDTLRAITFLLCFASFIILMYRGTFKMIVDRKNFYWDRFMNLVWSFVTCLGIGSVLYDNLPGGWRVWFVCAAGALQLYVVVCKSPYYQREKSDDVDSV